MYKQYKMSDTKTAKYHCKNAAMYAKLAKETSRAALNHAKKLKAARQKAESVRASIHAKSWEQIQTGNYGAAKPKKTSTKKVPVRFGSKKGVSFYAHCPDMQKDLDTHSKVHRERKTFTRSLKALTKKIGLTDNNIS